MYKEGDFIHFSKISKAIEAAYEQLLQSENKNEVALQYLKEAEKDVQKALGFSLSSRFQRDSINMYVPLPIWNKGNRDIQMNSIDHKNSL
ncbi:hypothetical protein [Fervidibacillus halotolerans]|uniref:Uncharacterized protein n=1 Tax=Fervidibacillus halotolerans TaxID=2980027 RepID=A0A9E8M0R9_9BACI|nr:hypothetical protein [Fervidibacillus halotolerans]WAA13257.1 hypothetical protein OE105_03805 [Fervidibacillus halotolerans]